MYIDHVSSLKHKEHTSNIDLDWDLRIIWCFRVENSFEEFLKSLELKLQYSKYKDTNITLPCIKGLAVMCFEIDSMNYYKLILQSAKDNIEINKTGKSLYGSKLISK